MAWEKLAKVALVASGLWMPGKKSHRVAAKFTSALKKAPPEVRQSWGARVSHRLNSLQRDLVELENLTPACAVAENTEYPWEIREGKGGSIVCWPARDITTRFSEPGLPSAMRLRKDFEVIESRFDEWF
ncbi:MAG: hypothetical protein ABI383_00590 [Acidobacteriaceae bacterium]